MMQALVDSRHMSESFLIDSAGTGGYHIGSLPDSRMRAHARRRGLSLDHRCRQVCESDFTDFDIIIGMDASNIANLRRMAPSPEAMAKVIPMSAFFSLATHYDHVPDPYYEGAEGFELVLDLLDDATLNLLDTIVAARD
jgi:protein-tyrosine phosphatase